ncbi:TTAGGG repeat binding factor [Coemansia sp. RSA 2322]|nr:TTAGGG repeat binding factor [Coemansia sp. RSA 2322]
MVVVGPASSGMPNRRRMVSSIGLEAAAKSFFTYVVPANLRSADTADLLVDLQTQQLLAAANDEEHLQALAVELRDMDDDHVAQLLGIESHDGDGGSKGNGGGSAQQFDLHAAAHYRKEVGRRLNKISGGKLHITRQQYSLHMLWKRVADFGSECSSGWRGPYILGDASSRLGDASFRTADDAEDEAGELSKCADLLDAGAAAVNGSAAPLDASFTHERKVAALLRDAQGDAHLSELLEAIETELIDISDSQALSRTPRQLRPARRLVEARVPSGGDANNSNDGTGAGFRVQADEDYGTESSEDIPHMVKRYARASRASATRASGQHEQAGGSPPHRPGAFRGRRGIAAEDPESLRYDAGERAAFTPSDRGTPEPEDHTRGADTRDAVSAYLSPAARRAKAPGREGAGGRLSPVVYIDNRNTARAYLSPSSRRSTASVWQAAKEHVAAAATARPPGRSAPAQPAKSKRRREASSDEDDEDGYSSTAAPAPARNRHAKPAQHRTRWTPEEEECLVTALLEFGPQWALILRYHGRDGLRSDVLRSRSRPNLKDKARNIKLRLKRDNKPLGPFEAVTG